MSATSDDLLALREHVDVPDDPTEVFGTLLERNEHVCKNCYRILGRWERVPNAAGDAHHDILAATEYELPEEYQFDLLDREYREDVPIDARRDDATPPTGSPTSGASRACWNCGVIETHRTPETRAKQEAIAAAAGISATLTEYAVEHDWPFLLGRVRDLKSTPEYAGNDYRVFSTAVAASIDAARSTT